MKLSFLLAASFFVTVAHAEPPVFSHDDLVQKSAIVVIPEFYSKETMPADPTLVKTDSKFNVLAVLKGDYREPTIVVTQYLWHSPPENIAQTLVDFSSSAEKPRRNKKSGQFLLYLEKKTDGYFATMGHNKAAQSFWPLGRCNSNSKPFKVPTDC